ncbi:hypothetical protein PLANPX_4669 [Lacipirellula parvula]|uniref:Uncharacterized protein n=1 Tax=Lacipirellula parvula TaxID=2650471 RepID=A0A5K7XG74_9BACT|nr:hypothetical protein PLANPX_4669 [Lacipirellula parvula]
MGGTQELLLFNRQGRQERQGKYEGLLNHDGTTNTTEAGSASLPISCFIFAPLRLCVRSFLQKQKAHAKARRRKGDYGKAGFFLGALGVLGG